MQVVLGFSIVASPYLGLIHGTNAIAIVAAAAVAALRVRGPPHVPPARRPRRPRGRARRPSRRELVRRIAVGVAVATALAAGAVAWSSTLLGEYSVMDMGARHDASRGPRRTRRGRIGRPAASGTPAAGTGTVSVRSLIADPDRPADVRVELVARQETVDVPGGRAVDGYTVNGTSPGPTIRARQGDLVEVVFVNESVAAGATLHWHGLDVPNAADGVAGVTQDAVPVGGRYVYRFVAEDAGTYWYHSHQVSHEQVVGGLLGAVVIEPPPRGPAAVARPTSSRSCTSTAASTRSTAASRTSTWRLRPARPCGYASSTPTRARPRSGRPRRSACRDRRARGERAHRRRRPEAAHPGGRPSGCRGAGARARRGRPARRGCPPHPRGRPRRRRPAAPQARRRSTCSPTATRRRSASTRHPPTAPTTT